MQNNFYFIGNFSNIYKNPSKRSEVTSQIIHGEKFKILSQNIEQTSDPVKKNNSMQQKISAVMKLKKINKPTNLI